MPLYVILAAAAIATAFPMLWWSVSSTRQPKAKLIARNLHGDHVVDLHQVALNRSARERALEPAVAALARRARRLTPSGMIENLEQKMALAGVTHWGIERVLAVKLLLGGVGLFFGFFVMVGNPSPLALVLTILAIAVGYLGPDYVLLSKARDRQSTIERQLADSLDQVTISVEAGLGFEAALHRMARTGIGPFPQEVARTLQDIQLGMPRRDALARLADRNDVADLRRFVHAVVQAEGYGVPIAHVLRTQAGELRERRRQSAEEQAMKIPVKIIFPLVFNILPTLFLVVLGPAVIRLVRDGLGG